MSRTTSTRTTSTRTTSTRTAAGTTLSVVALLVAVAGGGAAVAEGLGRDSVGARELKDGAVRSPELRDGSVTGQDVDESSLGRVPESDLAQSARSADKADHAVVADALVGFKRAMVSAVGDLQATQSTGAVSALETGTPGRYVVTFDEPVTGCFLLAGVANNGTGRVAGFASAWLTPADPTLTKVTVETHAPDVADATPDALPFSVAVVC